MASNRVIISSQPMHGYWEAEGPGCPFTMKKANTIKSNRLTRSDISSGNVLYHSDIVTLLGQSERVKKFYLATTHTGRYGKNTLDYTVASGFFYNISSALGRSQANPIFVGPDNRIKNPPDKSMTPRWEKNPLFSRSFQQLWRTFLADTRLMCCLQRHKSDVLR